MFTRQRNRSPPVAVRNASARSDTIEPSDGDDSGFSVRHTIAAS
jgi:hypothetical protein